MKMEEIAYAFKRAISFSFTPKKFLLVLVTLIACGLLFIFCRSLSFGAQDWISVSLVFLPIFLTTGILLSLGVILSRIYYHEVKSLRIRYKRILATSWDMIIGTAYLSLPILLTYLFLWALLGIFILLKQIPFIGPFIGVILSFGPFMLLLASVLLAFLCVALLFFIAPAVSLKSSKVRLKLLPLIQLIREEIFYALFLLFIALLPLLFTVAVLSFVAWLTQFSYQIHQSVTAVVMQWFFIMLPFSAALSPFIIFFFNFSVESYKLLQKLFKPASHD